MSPKFNLVSKIERSTYILKLCVKPNNLQKFVSFKTIVPQLKPSNQDRKTNVGKNENFRLGLIKIWKYGGDVSLRWPNDRLIYVETENLDFKFYELDLFTTLESNVYLSVVI